MARSPSIDSALWDFRSVKAEDIGLFEWWETRQCAATPKGILPPWLRLSEAERKAQRAYYRSLGPQSVRKIQNGERVTGPPSDIILHIPLIGRTKVEILREIEAILDAAILSNEPIILQTPKGQPSLIIGPHSNFEGQRRSPLKCTKRGMGGSRHRWESLKRIAAYRLHEAGLSFKPCLEFLRRRKMELGISGWPDVWPVYSTPKSFSRAIKEFARQVSDSAPSCVFKTEK